jgi:hypothetical protein
MTAGCARGSSDPDLYEYVNKNCRVRNGAGAGGPDARARQRGHELAVVLDTRGGRGGKEGAGGDVGQYLLFEAYDEDEDGDEVWLARTVGVSEFKGKSCKKMDKRTVLHRDESRSTTFDKGDHAIAVEWLERSASDPHRLTFVPGDGVVCYVNSTELRHFVVEGGVVPRPGGGGVLLNRQQEAHAQEWYR